MAESSAEGTGQGMSVVNFHHPYTPYNVQLEFMKEVYNVLERGGGQVGILESPTGTVSQSNVSPHSKMRFSH